jgi:hypothetical protein
VSGKGDVIACSRACTPQFPSFYGVGIKLFRVYVYQNQQAKGDTGSVVQWAVGNFTAPSIQSSLGSPPYVGLYPLPQQVLGRPQICLSIWCS